MEEEDANREEEYEGEKSFSCSCHALWRAMCVYTKFVGMYSYSLTVCHKAHKHAYTELTKVHLYLTKSIFTQDDNYAYHESKLMVRMRRQTTAEIIRTSYSSV